MNGRHRVSRDEGDPRRRGTGFTLLELVVVIALLGIVLSLVGLSMSRGGRDDRVLENAERLASVIRLLAQESVFTARPLGLDLHEAGYTAQRFDGQRWVSLDPTALGGGHLSEGVWLSDAAGAAYVADSRPDIVVLPDGAIRFSTVYVGDTLSTAAASIVARSGPALVAVQARRP